MKVQLALGRFVAIFKKSHKPLEDTHKQKETFCKQNTNYVILNTVSAFGLYGIFFSLKEDILKIPILISLKMYISFWGLKSKILM